MKTLELNPYKGFFPSISMLRLRVTSFDRCMGLFLTALILAEIMLARLVELHVPEHPLNLLSWRVIAVASGALIFGSLRQMPRLVDAAGSLLWGALYECPLAFLIQLAGRSPFGLVDRRLAWIDGRMHFETAFIHQSVVRFAFLATCSLLTYVLFVPMLLGAMTVPCLCGHVSASRRFVVGVLIAMLMGAALFVFFPAAGPWMSEAMRPSSIQGLITEYLLRLKSGLPMRAEMAYSALVSFPSEHVVVAVLGAQALGAIKSLKIPARIIAVLICISTITTGWHYGIDVLGGLLVAYVSSVLAKRICAVWERWDEQALAFGHLRQDVRILDAV